jgi:hypothetical protein
MGDRTNITDALEREALAEAARLLSADPDTEPDGEMPEAFSVVLDELIAVEPDDGFSREDVARAIVGMLQVAGLLTAEVLTDHNTSDGLFTEARRLLDAATPGPWTHPSPTANWFSTPQPIQIDEADWGQETQEGGAMCGYRIGTLADERAWRYADVELIAAAPRLIAALLAERDADVSAGAVARTVAMSHIAAERDAERAARERAEAEARQLREAISVESVGVDYCTLHHGIRNEDEHSCDFRDDDQESGDDGEPRECVLVELIPRPPLAVVAEGAEDR